MHRMVRLALTVLLSALCLTGCETNKTGPVVVAHPTIEYQPQDKPEKQLVCPDAPAVPGPTAGDKDVAHFTTDLYGAWNTCHRSVTSYLAFRKGPQ